MSDVNPIEQLGGPSQQTKKQKKDFLKSQFEQEMTRANSIQEKPNKHLTMSSQLENIGRSVLPRLEPRKHPIDRVNDQIKELKKPLNTFLQKEASEKTAILHSLPADLGDPFVQTFQASVQSFETSSDGAVEHYGGKNSDKYREQRHGHEEELNNTRAILSHMVEDLSTWHQFRTDRRTEIKAWGDDNERRQKLRYSLAEAKTMYAQVLEDYQNGDADSPQRQDFRKFVDEFKSKAVEESKLVRAWQNPTVQEYITKVNQHKILTQEWLQEFRELRTAFEGECKEQGAKFDTQNMIRETLVKWRNDRLSMAYAVRWDNWDAHNAIQKGEEFKVPTKLDVEKLKRDLMVESIMKSHRRSEQSIANVKQWMQEKNGDDVIELLESGLIISR